jgi:hypothetical protein
MAAATTTTAAMFAGEMALFVYSVAYLNPRVLLR